MSGQGTVKVRDRRPLLWLTAGGVLLAAGLLAGRRVVAQLINGSRLSELHPRARARIAAFLEAVQQRLGYSVRITSGYRTQQRQAELQRVNPYAVSAGTSPHVYGLAIDANFSKGGETLHSRSSLAAWEASGIPALARAYGLRWGGDFTTRDTVHFDYGWGASIAQAKLREAKARFGEARWFTADLRTIV